MESKRTATTYFIPPGKFLLMENALGNPDLIQSSVSSDCRVTIVDKANFPLDELEQWPTFRLVSADIQLKLGSGSYYIYIVVPTPDNEDTTTAFISYNTSLVDRDGYEVIASTDEDGNSVTSKGPLLGKEGFKYYQCGVVSERGKNLGAITVPEGLGRLISIDLGVNPQDDSVQKKMDKDYFNSLFIPHYDNPDNPEELTWIEAKSNLGVNGGITMYVNEGKYTPSTIMDALAVDNVNLKVVDGVLTFVGTSGSESVPLLGDLKNVGEWANAIATEDRIMVQKKDSTTWTSLLLSEIGGTADFSNVKESGEGNAFTSFTLSEDKKTLTFVKGDSFTKKADFDTLNAKVTDFLEGSDTDNIINKWKELEAFLDGMSESSDLADILSDKADKSTTLSGYGITNAYTKNEADDLLDEKADWGTTLSHYGITNAYTKTEADSLLDKKWTQDDSKIENWDTAFGWGDHSKAGYSTKTYVDETFVTLKTEQTITGKKDFTTGGLFVNGSQIVYDSTNGYWKLDGDLLVTGAVTMFANDGKYTPSTITDGVNIDNRTIIRKDGALMINPELGLGGGEGGELSSVAWGNIIGTPTWITDTKPEYKFEEIKEKPTTLDKYGITDAKIESGVITLGGNTITPLVESKANELYVTSLGTSGNNLIWTLNGEAKTITVPYASKSNKATYSTFLRAYLGNYERISDLNEPSTYTEDQSTLSDSPFRIVYDAFSRNAANKPETFNNANVLLTLFKGVHTTGVGQYVSQLYFPDADVVYFRRSTSDGFKGWKKFAFTDSDITGNAATSTKATQDADGNVISSTYAKGDGTNATGTWNISISGESNRVKCTEGTRDAYRPMVVTNPDATTQNLFYGTKIQGNYATGDLKMTSATIDEIKIYKSNDDVLYLDCNLVVRGGVTMYGTNSASAPSILDSLPIANTSGTKGIATFDSTYFIVSNGKVSLIADSVGLNEDELAAYLTQEKYAKQSDIDTRINGLIDGAPEAYDTLKEIADVLDKNVNGVGDILEALGNKADKGTTLAEYGISDAKISDGTITLGGNTITPLTQSSGDARYVTTLGTSGNDLTWTLNGLLKKITIPYATTANQLTKWKVLTIKKNTDAGTVYKLIANLSNWNTGYNGQWGMVGMMYGHRGGYMSGTTMQKIVAYCAAWSASSGGTGYELKTDITTYVKPCIVSYNGVTYLALKMAGSGSSREHSFLGYTENLLEEFIEVTESAATLVHDTEVMSMGGVNVASSSKLATPRTIWGQSFDGTENVSGAITGATTGSFSDEVSMKSASVDGISIYKSSTGVLRIDGDVVLSGALTMFGTDSVNTSTIMDGVVVDGTTIIKKDGKTLMLNPNIELGGGLDDVNVTGAGNAVTGASLSNNILTLTKGATFLTSHQTIYNLTMNAGKFTAVTFDPNGAAQIVNIPTKTSHLANDSNFITSSYVDGKFVTIAGDEDVTGVHNFTNGLEVGGIKVSKSQDGVIYLEGNLVVSGGVTMFGTNSVTSSTVMDGVMVDDTTIRKNPTTGKLEVIGGTGGGLDESALASYLTTNKYLTQTTGDTRYVTALGINGNNLTWTKNGTVNNIIVPYATTAKELTSYSAITFSKSDNGGKPCYLLIADVTSWYNVSSGSSSYGIVGFVYGYRDGSSPAYSVNIAARCSYGKGYYSLNSNLTSIIEPRVVSYNSNYYLALYLRGSNRTFNFIGRKNNLLSSFTELQCSDSGGAYSGLNVIYSGSATGTVATATKLSTARIISITGHATGSGSFDGSSDLGINVAIPTRNVYINGTGYTVHSTITTDTTGIYAPTSGGTSGYVLKANGATSIPTWVTQSSLSVGTAAKLSTVSKTAWGQNYWTSGGVPTSISGDMSNVGNVTSETSNSYSLGSSSNLWKDVWAGNVKYTDSAYLGFTSSYASIRHGGSGSQLIVESTSVRTNSTASARASLGTSSVPWAGLYSTLGNFSEKITMSGTTADACNITFERSHGYIQFNSSINFSSGTASGADTVMRIANTGMVGINTYSPEYALHVIGDIGNAYARLRYSESNPFLHLYRETTDENWYVQAINGYIAIGSTSSKSCKIDTSGNLLATGGMTAGAFSFANGYQKSISSAGWYRFATSTTANNAGGTYMFFIRRSYANSNNEAYIISCIVDHGKVHWNLLNGHANTRLITQVRCTYTNSGTIYFDLYYNGAVSNTVYVNAVGDCTLQVPTATTSTLTSTSTFDLGDGMIIDGDLLVKGGITMYATSSTSPITEFYTSRLVLTETENSTAFNDKGIMFGSEGNARIGINTSNDVGIYAGKRIFLRPDSLSASSSVGMCLETTGNAYLSGGLTIGATSSNSNVVNNTYKLHVTGKAYVTGTLTQGSDIRYKYIHKDILLPLATMAEAPSFEFNFKDDEQKSTHIGTSAQYWQSVKGVVTEDSEGRLGMDYSSLGVVMGISLAKELSRFESDTDRRIRLLEEENEELRKEIEQLKNK